METFDFKEFIFKFEFAQNNYPMMMACLSNLALSTYEIYGPSTLSDHLDKSTKSYVRLFLVGKGLVGPFHLFTNLHAPRRG